MTSSSRDRTWHAPARHRLAALLFLLMAGLVTAMLNPWRAQARQAAHITAPGSPAQSGSSGGNTFVGTAACLKCHGWAASQPSTGMGMAARDPRTALPLDERSMIYKDGSYTISLQQAPAGLQMSATDGKESLSVPVRWIFGQGYLGQTFILEKDGQLYESRASYYRALNALDLTIGHSAKPRTSLLAALGRPLPPAEVTKCFSCHTSEDTTDGKLDLAIAHPGVTCENCHGAGQEHAADPHPADTASTKHTADMINPGTLPAADLNDFCGSCHRTTRDVLDSGIRDIRNVRFQPYRLENSRCYDPTDRRITCVACHNPHRNLETSSQSYDASCLACHANRGVPTAQLPKETRKAPACPRASSNCVSCHMPKLEMPGAHFAFTDHYIRIQRPGEPYPG